MLRALMPILVLGLTANLEPGTLVVFVMLLGTEKPRTNALAFLAGWFTSLAAVFAISYALLHGEPPVSGSTEELLVQLGEIVVGLVLGWVAVHEWRRRHDPPGTAPPRTARWLQHIGPRSAFFAAMWEQPWTVTMAAAMVVVRAHLDAPAAFAAFVVFAIASTALIGAVWVVFRRDPQRAERMLGAAEARVRSKGPRVFAVVSAVASVAFLADAVYGLAGR
jgi:threonine/homoserine/homoserine lactone efflux protein